MGQCKLSGEIQGGTWRQTDSGKGLHRVEREEASGEMPKFLLEC